MRIPVSLMSDFMAADGGGEYCYVDDWDYSLETFRKGKFFFSLVDLTKVLLKGKGPILSESYVAIHP